MAKILAQIGVFLCSCTAQRTPRNVEGDIHKYPLINPRRFHFGRFVCGRCKDFLVEVYRWLRPDSHNESPKENISITKRVETNSIHPNQSNVLRCAKPPFFGMFVCQVVPVLILIILLLGIGFGAVSFGNPPLYVPRVPSPDRLKISIYSDPRGWWPSNSFTTSSQILLTCQENPVVSILFPAENFVLPKWEKKVFSERRYLIGKCSSNK